MATLWQRATQRRSITFPSPGLESSWPFGSLSRPVNGEEGAPAGEFEALVESVYRANGPVAALMFVRQLVFSEARFMWRRRRGGRPGDLFGNSDLGLLESPWPGGTTGDLLTRMIMDADLAGNSYWTSVEGRLRRLRPDWVTIVTGSKQEPDLYGDALDGELLGYIYHPRGPGTGRGEVLLPEQVAHFGPLPDPLAHYRAMSWLTPVIREVRADQAATTHKGKFFDNGATPQLVVRLDASVSPEAFARFREKMDETHAGAHNAYRTLYLGGGADVTAVGADLKQLDFKATQGAGETRLAAAAGVPPVIVGFSEGLQGSSLNAGNYAASRRRFADGTLRPLWRNAAGSLANILTVPSDAELWVDTRDIAFLREDAGDSAKIEFTKAQTIRQLIDGGFEPASVVDAVNAEDMSRLVHSGNLSVQLQPAGKQPAKDTQQPAGGQ